MKALQGAGIVCGCTSMVNSHRC